MRRIYTQQDLDNCKRTILEAIDAYSVPPREDAAGGIWTMTDAEFKESLRAAREEAWEEGLIAGVSHFGQMSAPPNPYADRKMTPAEVEEWRKTCPYPEALGK